MNAYVNLPAERMGLNRTMHLSIGPPSFLSDLLDDEF